jgi:hypothetical protein
MSADTPNLFEDAATELEEAAPWGNHARWTFPFEDYGNMRGGEQAWEEMEKSFRPALDIAARAWVSSREWPNLSAEQDYFFCLRFISAYRFLRQFPTDITSLFQSPAVSLPIMLQWMLVSWWESVGNSEALVYVEPSDFGPSLN